MYDFSLHYSVRKSILLLFHFTLGYFVLYPRLLVYGLNTLGLEPWLTNGMADISYSVIMIITSVYLTRDLLMRSINVFVDNPWKTFKVIFTTFPMMLLGSFAMNYLISNLTGQAESSNQSYLIEMFEQYPYLIMIQALIYAPIVEEIMFRGLVFGALSKKSIPFAMFISSMLFGIAHVFDSIITGNFADLWFIPTYALLGYFLNRAYLKSGTLVSSMTLHFMNNALGLWAMTLLGLF